MPRRFQFSLGRLFAAMACFALAALSGKALFSPPPGSTREDMAWLLIGSVSFGAAFGLLTRNAEWGAVAGMLAVVVILLLG